MDVKMASITIREQQVLELISHEYTSKEIAHKLFIAFETVQSHRKNLYRKLRVKSPAGLIRKAFELQLLTISKDDKPTNPCQSYSRLADKVLVPLEEMFY